MIAMKKKTTKVAYYVQNMRANQTIKCKCIIIKSMFEKELWANIEHDYVDLCQRLARFFRDAVSACDAGFPTSRVDEVMLELDDFMRNLSNHLFKCGYPYIAGWILISWFNFLCSKPDMCQVVFATDNIEKEE